MLTKLHIQNYAIIDELSIDFTAGLNIITGETGAGKSILMGALNLILGQRADSSVLQDQLKKCIVEGTFKIASQQVVIDFFSTHELDFEEEIIIRREIGANGKSRSFINDTLVNLSQIKQLSIFLVDLHQQFDTLEINSENFQREVLDALAENANGIAKLKKEFESYNSIKKQLADLYSKQITEKKELEYNQFLLDEFDSISLKENELEQIDSELKVLNNAEGIKQQLSFIYNELNNVDHPIVQQLKSLYNKLMALDSCHEQIPTIAQRLLSTSIELQDVADDLERIESTIHFNAERISILNDRLSMGYKLLKKHGVHSTHDLLAIQESLQNRLNLYADISNTIATLEKEESTLYNSSLKMAEVVSERRLSQVKPFTASVNELLAKVGMPNARIKIDIQKTDLTVNGIDAINYLFDANKNNKFENLGKVASGGELSRLMLSIKSLVARKLSLPTLIFDEIDTGISGEAAKQVGMIMQDLSKGHQLIAITHQAQIAAKATTHFFVYKETLDKRVKTGVRILNKEESILAIAKMLSGEKPTAASLENAKEIMGH